MHTFMAPQRMNPNEFGDPLTFPPAVNVSIGRIAMKLGPNLHVLLKMNCNNGGGALKCHLVSASDPNLETFGHFFLLLLPNGGMLTC